MAATHWCLPSSALWPYSVTYKEQSPHTSAEGTCSNGASPTCNPDPRAPHGFDRNGSHNAGRYVCECEGWEEHKPADMGIPASEEYQALMAGCLE